ncbi:CoA ester lyase [Cupriavidus sp. TA19]|uniref:HpcH/HpaI aldolase/citrate lyase family protein n=1 Tax=unclassified Cupriavidus TaxID=2640874 RepID=UPI000E2F5D8F|nr:MULTISPECIES: CoA ester lyase [unclassified Cupriavidus]BDB24072.1 CoA ester lyase [Cupriavidus sp. P-10]GLC92775.1 CoA ester lyase [Cupriavidus sp. TA19]
MTTTAIARSYLFVPANRPERFAKAHASGADRVILDLEDAVSESDKDRARHLLAEYLAAGGTGLVRINATQTRWFEDDMRACLSPGVQGVVLPKAESAGQVAQVTRHLPPQVKVLPLIETAAGMTNVAQIAAAPGVERLIFGTVDFRTELGIEGDDEELLFFRSMLVLASRTAGIAAPVDGVTVSIADADELGAASVRGRRLGFGAKLCIHPSQVEAVNAAYRPSDARVAWAERVIAAAKTSPGAFQLDGEMVDAPVIARATDLLRQAGRNH